MTRILILIWFAACFFRVSESKGQIMSIDSLKYTPINPTKDDTIYIVLYASTGTYGYKHIINHNTTPGNILIEACYFTTAGAQVTWYTDTIKIGPLPPGKYKITANARRPADTACTTFLYSVTATDSFVIPDPESVALHNLQRVSFYPNPAQDEITLTLPNGLAATQVKLQDIHGILIRRYEGDDRKLNISGIPQGLYFLHIETNKGKAVLRFLKE